MLYLIIITVILLLLPSIYIIRTFKKIEFIKNIKNKYLYHVSYLIPVILMLILVIFYDITNTMVIYLHFTIFQIIINFIFYIIKKISKKELKHYASVILSIIITVLYLNHAYYLAHHVIKTEYQIDTNKLIDNLSVVQVTDSHISTTMNGKDFIKYMEEINLIKPDIVVITGDFVDDDTTLEDLIDACIGLGKLETKYGVFFTYGNHDKGYFDYREFNDSRLREELIKNNVKILEDEIYDITDSIVIVGRQDTQVKSRKKISELTKNIDKNKYIIVLDHEPNDYENEKNEEVDLVLSGHTHGGQLFPLGPLGVLMGANDSYYGLEKRDNTNFIVSSGIGDWTIKFKTGCISEYVLINIKNAKN